MKNFYEHPTQIMFLDLDNFFDEDKPKYTGGIAYCGEIICGCCGGIFNIDELQESYDEMLNKGDIPAECKKYPLIKELTWEDISEEILKASQGGKKE